MGFLYRTKRFFSPAYHLRRRTAKRTGRTVQQGPFRGMRYVDHAYGSVYYPKLLGTYEREIYPWIEQAVAMDHDRVVNVGVGEGYFAVGLAKRQEAPVIGFECDPEAAGAAQRLAMLNGVEGKLRIEGPCDPAALQATLDEAERPLLICDVDGYETELLDPSAAPALGRTTMLVELHEFASPGVTNELNRRFAASHRIELVAQTPRTDADYPYRDGWVRWAPNALLVEQVDEMRPHEQSWLWLVPRNAEAAAA